MKIQISANQFSKFRQRIASEFPNWRTDRLVQVIENGNTLQLHPLNGYQLSADELAVVAGIEADIAECEPAAQETHGWRPLNTPRRHYATQKQILRQLDKVRF